MSAKIYELDDYRKKEEQRTDLHYFTIRETKQSIWPWKPLKWLCLKCQAVIETNSYKNLPLYGCLSRPQP